MSAGHFDIRDPLPTGTTLLEASAGTGKTWTIGALVTRYVAEEGVPLERMLVVTFGRAASQELRERVRTQLVEAERALSGEPVTEPSDLLDLLLSCTTVDRPTMHRRVTEALAGFDGATIATTHQFCSMVLGSLGVAGDTDSRARLVEDLDELLGEVVDDLYLRAFAYAEADPVFTHAEAHAIARTAVNDPQARLEPAAEDGSTPAGRRVAFARAVRVEMERRKRRLGILSYDDLLSQLADALEDADAPARARMRQRWQIVLVDEFQDTDPVQWQVLDRAFTGHATMVLIGDPKQAIYAFRGGDVTTYLQAAETAGRRQTLAVNWRSDAALLKPLQTMLAGAALGDGRIVVHDVDAHHQESRLVGAPSGAPFRLRVVRRDQFTKRGTNPLTVGQVRPHVARDLALDIRALLASDATYDGQPVQPRDVAVISYRHSDLAAAQTALHEVGVPAVIAGGGSVFATPAAVEWLELLEALEQPHRSPRVRAAALTCFFGHTAVELDERSDELTDEVADVLREWAEVLAVRGVAAVLEAANAGGLPARMLARFGGERRLTDLRHIGEVLHEIALTDRLGVVALLTWLRSQVAEGKAGRGAERTRRLDSDAAAVQLVTIHASKGLEYPVVYLPALADRNVPKPSTPLSTTPTATAASTSVAEGVRGGTTTSSAGSTRSPASGCGSSTSRPPAPSRRSSPGGRRPAHPRVAAAPDAPGSTPWVRRRTGRVRQPHRRRGGRGVRGLAGRGRPRSGARRTRRRSGRPAAGGHPRHVRPLLHRTVDTTWRRTSYSALTAARTSRPQASAASRRRSRRRTRRSRSHRTPSRRRWTASRRRWAGCRWGRPSGRSSTPSSSTPIPTRRTCAELLGHVDEQLVRWPVDLDRGELADALVQVCDSPLGPLADDATLRTIGRGDRLREMEFELPLAGGDLGTDRGNATLADLAPILLRHLPEGDPVRPYADALAHPLLGGQSLRGYLTGSVDVVLRLAGPRYLIVDYKTNWLGSHDEPLTAHDYRPEAMAAAMGHSDYPLQALLYAVVLHRFLRWRQPGYDPATHLGGVLYLYLRGMCGPGTPRVDGHPCGIFSWQPPVALVEEISDLLDGVR